MASVRFRVRVRVMFRVRVTVTVRFVVRVTAFLYLNKNPCNKDSCYSCARLNESNDGICIM